MLFFSEYIITLGKHFKRQFFYMSNNAKSANLRELVQLLLSLENSVRHKTFNNTKPCIYNKQVIL